MTVFLSYARNDSDTVAQLRADLDELRGPVWMDSRLTGGQKWWEEILESIRTCDLFVLAVSPASLGSQACQHEWGYALALRRPVLPVKVKPMDLASLPDDLRQLQVVEYLGASAESFRALAKALLRQESAPALPARLPAPPPLPEGYGDAYRRQLARPKLDMDAQLQLAAVLKAHADDPVDGPDARDLLAQLRARKDIVLMVATDIDQFVGQNSGGPPPTPPPTGPVAPVAPLAELPPQPETGPELEAGPDARLTPGSPWAERLRTALIPFVRADLAVAPNIPAAKLANARKEAELPDEEPVLALIDCTWFGSAKNCIVFTPTRVRQHHSKLTPNITGIPYTVLADVGYVVAGNDVKDPVSGSYWFTTDGSAVPADVVVGMLDTVKALLPEMPPA